MSSNPLYKEKVILTAVKLTVGMLSIAVVAFLTMLVLRILVPDVYTITPHIWYDLIMSVVFIIIAIFFINFYKLSISINSESVTVNFGLFKDKIPWDNIKSCSTIKANTISYKGVGIRTRNIQDIKSKGYIINNCDQIILEFKTGKLKELVFSTKNANLIQEIINQRITKTE